MSDKKPRDELLLGVIVPTLNAGSLWPVWIEALKNQCVQPVEVLVLDSSSDDGTASLAERAGFTVKVIQRDDFDHGGTRQLGVLEMAHRVDIVVLLTQDAILSSSESLRYLVGAFDSPEIACAYGRQIAGENYSDIARHHRAFNYPPTAHVSDAGALSKAGLKAAFCSNSFAAYRVKSLLEVGGFPAGTVFGEDMITAIKLLLAGHKKAYIPEAVVNHAHNYSIPQEVRRYFDMGVMHASEPLILDLARSGVSGRGFEFVRSELAVVGGRSAFRITHLVFRNAIRWLSFQLGKRFNLLPHFLILHLTMNKSFFIR